MTGGGIPSGLCLKRLASLVAASIRLSSSAAASRAINCACKSAVVLGVCVVLEPRVQLINQRQAESRQRCLERALGLHLVRIQLRSRLILVTWVSAAHNAGLKPAHRIAAAPPPIQRPGGRGDFHALN